MAIIHVPQSVEREIAAVDEHQGWSSIRAFRRLRRKYSRAPFRMGVVKVTLEWEATILEWEGRLHESIHVYRQLESHCGVVSEYETTRMASILLRLGRNREALRRLAGVALGAKGIEERFRALALYAKGTAVTNGEPSSEIREAAASVSAKAGVAWTEEQTWAESMLFAAERFEQGKHRHWAWWLKMMDLTSREQAREAFSSFMTDEPISYWRGIAKTQCPQFVPADSPN